MRHLREIFARQVAHARRLIGESFPKGTCVTDPEGGFILWVEMPRSVDALELFHRCYERGVVIAPGPMFTATGRYGNCIRLAVGACWSAKHDAALREAGRIASRMCDSEGGRRSADANVSVSAMADLPS